MVLLQSLVEKGLRSNVLLTGLWTKVHTLRPCFYDLTYSTGVVLHSVLSIIKEVIFKCVDLYDSYYFIF